MISSYKQDANPHSSQAFASKGLSPIRAHQPIQNQSAALTTKQKQAIDTQSAIKRSRSSSAPFKEWRARLCGRTQKGRPFGRGWDDPEG